MVEKKHTHLLRIHPKLDELTFSEHISGVTTNFDQALLQKYLPVTSGVQHGDQNLADTLGVIIPDETREALRQTDFLGVYGRVVRSKQYPHLICLQYLYVWDYQAVPAHEGDYEPIFVYLDEKQHYAIYDLVHYCARKLDFQLPFKGTLGLRAIPGWHSFIPAYLSESSQDRDLQVKPLSDQHLRTWWSIPDLEARLKIVNHLKDPFQMHAPGHFMDEPDENSKTMCCTFLEIEKALAEFDDPKVAVIEGIKRAFGKCVGLLALHRLGAFIQLLGEMNDIGLVNAPTSTTGINIANLGALLKDGFVSVTKVGKAFFDGFYSRQPSDEED